MKVLQLDSSFDIAKTRDKIEQTWQKLEVLINSEDSSSLVMQQFRKKVAQINQILFELNAEDKINPDILLQKSKNLEKIGSLLLQAASQYQESFSEVLFLEVKHWGLWFQGTAKEYEIHALAKQSLYPSEQQLIQYIELITYFVEHYWETHPEKIFERKEFALQLIEANNSSISNKSSRFREVSQKFIETTISAAEKVKLKETASASVSVKQVLNWVINSPGWQGDDLEFCLDIIESSRIQTEF
ncbi:hypothetical protein [Chlorogloea sp. CCALA 695]|uniref:hypothetical protein n=1 Tax=Chlorogloea sp. CCALA 695 TaxID=2107693 RepID=UPI000D05426D|nr:hypothetical protein [Chlorogloea sp. CCALA 695]PSB31670.1 hypothetical protein C7B70_12400 [Chlorogloea sp. CCALA 695]